MEIRLLGVVEASADGIALPLGGPRQRAVLADLALHAGQTVPASRLIDDLWGEKPPASAKHTLETYVSRLRHVLKASGAAGPSLVTRPGGYLLDVAPECVDAYQFRDLAVRGSSACDQGSPAAAVTLLSSAVKLWRGPALADVQDASFAVLARQLLEEERLTASEKLMQARLALGQHRELVPELEALIGGSPYRERFHAQLMLALYRSGRQAEALAAFGRARDLLAGELGIEPGRELRELQRAVLRQAPGLESGGGGAAGQPPVANASPPVHHQPATSGGTPTRRLFSLRRGRAWRWAAVAVAVVLGVAIGVPVLLSPGSAVGGVLVDGVGELTAAGGIGRSLDLPDPPGAAVAADGSLWVTSPEGNVVYRIDPLTASIVQAVPGGIGPQRDHCHGPRHLGGQHPGRHRVQDQRGHQPGRADHRHRHRADRTGLRRRIGLGGRRRGQRRVGA